MRRADKMSMKAFWEAMERRLAACSTDELRAILRAMAQETPPAARQAFLGKMISRSGLEALAGLSLIYAARLKPLLRNLKTVSRT